MNKFTQVKCSQILERLISWDLCFPFVEMVDPEKDGAPDYLDFVKEPMSLNEVKKRLKEGHYNSIESFQRDVNLIWENAKIYNGDDTLLYYMAMEAKLWFEKRIKKIHVPNEVEWTEKFQKTKCGSFPGRKIYSQAKQTYSGNPARSDSFPCFAVGYICWNIYAGAGGRKKGAGGWSYRYCGHEAG